MSNAPFHLLFGTDLLALAFYSGGLALLFHLLTRPAAARRQAAGYGAALAMSGLGFAACLMRFAYYPLAFFLPLTLLLFGWRWRPVLRRPALAALLLLTLLVSSLVFYQARVAGDAYYLTQFYTQLATEPSSRATLGLYWHHLRLFDPVFYHSFFSNELDFSRIPRGQLVRAVAVVLVSGLVAGLLLVGLGREWRAARHRGRWWPTRRLLFHGLALGTALLCTGLLVAFSLRYPAALVGWFPGAYWTYVADTRYFLPAFLSISALVLVLVLARPPRLPVALRVLGLGLLGGSLLLSLVTRDRRTAQLVWQQPAFSIDKVPGQPEDVRRLDSLLHTAGAGQPVLFGRNYYNKRVEIAARLAGHIILDADSLLAHRPLRTSRPVLMLFDLNSATAPSPAVVEFLRRHRARPQLGLPTLGAQILTLEIRPTDY
ncbi:hypothetical protein [Hymenobacter cellulosilyticus]|uniref:Uncharacterized protein n=1 Tax=Hymenobacter cellulosilyticus TaxID=2932248 RepID=A0A8T9Q813_9BACT|nr:hypothetical protein [Hymenobacter cellulosilyticus]UOQ73082.1 hypothetical protein MUN79_03650 [Hymenobacter cellulosilyticus]